LAAENFDVAPAVLIFTTSIRMSLANYACVGMPACCLSMTPTLHLSNRLPISGGLSESNWHWGVCTLRIQDTSDPRHFGTMCLELKCLTFLRWCRSVHWVTRVQLQVKSIPLPRQMEITLVRPCFPFSRRD